MTREGVGQYVRTKAKYEVTSEECLFGAFDTILAIFIYPGVALIQSIADL